MSLYALKNNTRPPCHVKLSTDYQIPLPVIMVCSFQVEGFIPCHNDRDVCMLLNEYSLKAQIDYYCPSEHASKHNAVNRNHAHWLSLLHYQRTRSNLEGSILFSHNYRISYIEIYGLCDLYCKPKQCIYN